MMVALVGLGACGEDGGRSLAPIVGDGTVAVPRQPIIVDPLPTGWSVREVKNSPQLPTEMQTVYLGAGSTLEDGPAIAVAALGVEFGEGLCAPEPVQLEPTDVRFDPESAYTAYRYENGKLISFEGERDAGSEEWGFVLGRDLDEPTLRRVAKAADFATDTPRIPQLRSPRWLRAVRPVAGHPQRRVRPGHRATGPGGGGNGWLEIGAYDGDAASDAVARFWGDTVVRAKCDDNYRRASATVDGTNVLLLGTAPKPVMETVVAGSARRTRPGWRGSPGGSPTHGRRRSSVGAKTRIPSSTARVTGCGGSSGSIGARTVRICSALRSWSTAIPRAR